MTPKIATPWARVLLQRGVWFKVVEVAIGRCLHVFVGGRVNFVRPFKLGKHLPVNDLEYDKVVYFNHLK